MTSRIRAEDSSSKEN